MRLAIRILIFCVGALLALGMVMLFSASMTQKGTHYLGLQLRWCVLGLVVCAVAAWMDYRWWKRGALWLLGLSAVALVLVFVPGIGQTINGATRWIKIGPMNFQPSELAKLAAIIALAAHAERHQRRMSGFKYGLLIPGVGIALFLGLILAGRDYGTTILFGLVCAMLLVVAGTRWRYILPIMAAGALFFSWALWHDAVRRERILAWWYPEEYKEGVGYQAYQAMLALGSGGISGRGLGDGRQKLGFVPEHHTDFILAIIGEEWGVIATLAIVAAFVAILLCGIVIAWRARDPFGLYVAAGITFLLGMQGFINMAVVTSLLPNKGLPLPFISYGGSNLLVLLGAVGILLSIARQAEAREDEQIEGASLKPAAGA